MSSRPDPSGFVIPSKGAPGAAYDRNEHDLSSRPERSEVERSAVRTLPARDLRFRRSTSTLGLMNCATNFRLTTLAFQCGAPSAQVIGNTTGRPQALSRSDHAAAHPRVNPGSRTRRQAQGRLWGTRYFAFFSVIPVGNLLLVIRVPGKQSLLGWEFLHSGRGMVSRKEGLWLCIRA
jgi:hypothetical protein